MEDIIVPLAIFGSITTIALAKMYFGHEKRKLALQEMELQVRLTEAQTNLVRQNEQLAGRVQQLEQRLNAPSNGPSNGQVQSLASHENPQQR